LADLRTRHPELRVLERDVQADAAARQELYRRCKELGLVPAVPAFLIGGRLHVGFEDATTTGAQLEALLAGASRAAPRDRIRLPLVGAITLDALGFPLFTLLVGLVVRGGAGSNLRTRRANERSSRPRAAFPLLGTGAARAPRPWE
jgi:hypothetical protein